MKKFEVRRIYKLSILLALQAVLVACGSSSGEFSPQVASPPPFDYVDGQVLRSRMHQLAFASMRLDLALIAQNERDNSIQGEVVDLLREIERIANDLEEGDLSTTHRFLRNDMQNFQATVNRALRNAERNPPSFYAAGQVTGSCMNCHRAAQ